MPKPGFKVVTVREYAVTTLDKAVKRWNRKRLKHEQKSKSAATTTALLEYAAMLEREIDEAEKGANQI